MRASVGHCVTEELCHRNVGTSGLLNVHKGIRIQRTVDIGTVLHDAESFKFSHSRLDFEKHPQKEGDDICHRLEPKWWHDSVPYR